jgi:hypothetical protein
MRSRPAIRQLGRPEQRPVDLDLPGVRLGVNHKHAGRRDRDVIDVPASPRHAPVVKDDRRAFSRPPVERFADCDLTEFARPEQDLVLWRVLKPEQESADVVVRATDARLATGPAPLVLTPSAGAWVPPLEQVGLLRVRGLTCTPMACETGDRLGAGVPPGLGARIDAGAAQDADIRSTELEDPRCHAERSTECGRCR